MELKLLSLLMAYLPATLLIVPYGIETAVRQAFFRSSQTLLIVPYGIETEVQYIEAYTTLHF